MRASRVAGRERAGEAGSYARERDCPLTGPDGRGAMGRGSAELAEPRQREQRGRGMSESPMPSRLPSAVNRGGFAFVAVTGRRRLAVGRRGAGVGVARGGQRGGPDAATWCTDGRVRVRAWRRQPVPRPTAASRSRPSAAARPGGRVGHWPGEDGPGAGGSPLRGTEVRMCGWWRTSAK